MRDRPMDRMLPRCWKGGILSRSAAVEQVRAHRRHEVKDEKPVVCQARRQFDSRRPSHGAAPLQRPVYSPIRNLGMGPRAGCGLNKSRNFGTQPTAFEAAIAACEIAEHMYLMSKLSASWHVGHLRANSRKMGHLRAGRKASVQYTVGCPVKRADPQRWFDIRS